MHYFLHVRMEGFYASRHFSDRVVAVVRDGVVLDCTDDRVPAGMLASEARTILEGAQFLPWEEEPYRDAQREYLDVCAEFAVAIEPLDQHVVRLDFTGHPQPRPLVDALVARLPGARVGIGPNLEAAAIACREADRYQPIVDATRNLANYLDGVPIRIVDAFLPETRERLGFLGYERLGELRSLSQTTLRRQFGDEGIAIFRLVRGMGSTEIRSLYPPDSVAERLAFEGAVEDLIGLERGIAELADRLGGRLSAQDSVGKTIELAFEFEDGPPERRRRTFAREIGNAAGARAALALLAAKPPETPAIAIFARMPDLRRSAPKQRTLESRIAREAADDSRDAALERVRATFGDRAIAKAAEVEIPRRRRVLQAWRDATGWA